LFFSGARLRLRTFFKVWSRTAEKQKAEIVGGGVL
jgi:hypothetical protein